MRPAADYLCLIDARWHPGGAMADAGERHDEYEDIRELLLDGAEHATPQVTELAACVARACLGNDHLWHDLGLPERRVLSELLGDHFPHLAARNVHNMRWKKFFYKQLCEQVGVRACRAPSCGVCVNFHECFDDETLPLAQLTQLTQLAA
jgi:nitrogen fixation protein NifQ